mmetsp:Transcript_8724/g.25147  ORF Transcript_8724/g.25147 Transcript_8724/m.25147 type:complete len:402 (+) Transcript_8724:100-1305(+)|eukprot:CAMPEP_0117671894 /NCGR_PEP_ID=MMETSP0804-20121206/13602_1 /TAXON_ID=1074897 /ORGANISM="Tetraselmis astigmatica, Strain CCMP880" /LENGTH=401 /DNA_ID=CAMNT_0005480435 /DNA_START=31 /DNA_END=1236 /DNA_ORIENTATION=-
MRFTAAAAAFLLVLVAVVPDACVSDSTDTSTTVGVLMLDCPVALDYPSLLREAGPEGAETISGEVIPTLVSAMLGVAPPGRVDSEVSKQVEGISVPNVFNRPTAVFSVQVVGAGPAESEFLKSKCQSQMREVSATAPELMQHIDTVFPSFEDSVMHYPLDHNAMEGCDAMCVETALSEAVSNVGGSYATGKGVMDGLMTLPLEEGAVTLDLSNEADRMCALELATLHKTVEDILAESDARAVSMSNSMPKYFDATLTCPQRIRDAYGAESDSYKAATRAQMAMISLTLGQISSCHDSKVYAQVVCHGDVNSHMQESSGDILQWIQGNQMMRGRVLFAADSLAAPAGVGNSTGGGDGNQWSITALTWTAFWVLLWFTWMGVYVLCTMPFKQDSLLYSKSKSE